VKKILASIRALRSALFAPLALTAPCYISTGMSDLQSQMNAAMEEAWHWRRLLRADPCCLCDDCRARSRCPRFAEAEGV